MITLRIINENNSHEETPEREILCKVSVKKVNNASFVASRPYYVKIATFELSGNSSSSIRPCEMYDTFKNIVDIVSFGASALKVETSNVYSERFESELLKLASIMKIPVSDIIVEEI